MAEHLKNWTDAQIVAELGSKSPLNNARQVFSSWRARIEQAAQQQTPPGPLDVRRMEFAAVIGIAKILDVCVESTRAARELGIVPDWEKPRD